MFARLMIVALLFACCGKSFSQDPNVSASYRALVPFNLLPLVHAAETQNELGLSTEQITDLEEYFVKELDGPWFRSRILPAEKQNVELDRLESQFWTWASKEWTADQVERLKQLELQSLGSRMLLRNDVVKQLNLTTAQLKLFAEAAQSTFDANKKLQDATTKGASNSALETAVQDAVKAEQQAFTTKLTTDQLKKLSVLAGEKFDTTRLQRIYPMAPEFVEGTEWFNSSPVTLQSLRGKVVLVHFYAFQCHNCHANFEIYRRWHEQLQEKGVVVIGIQSPETAQEKDPEQIRKAALERNLAFPIVLDVKMQNWNTWANTMWPTVYVIDKRGYLRHWWQGELNWQGATGDKTIEQIVEKILDE